MAISLDDSSVRRSDTGSLPKQVRMRRLATNRNECRYPQYGPTSARVDRRYLRNLAAVANSLQPVFGWGRMLRDCCRLILVCWMASTLAACGLADSRSGLPESL